MAKNKNTTRSANWRRGNQKGGKNALAKHYANMTPEEISAEQRRRATIGRQTAAIELMAKSPDAARVITRQALDDSLDPSIQQRAALAILDRVGLGPGSSLRVEDGQGPAQEVQMQVLLEAATQEELELIGAAQAAMQRIAERVARGEAAPVQVIDSKAI